MKSYEVKDSNYTPIKGKWVKLDIIRGMTSLKDPVIHKSELDRILKNELKDVVRKDYLDKVLDERLNKALQPIYRRLGIDTN